MEIKTNNASVYVCSLMNLNNRLRLTGPVSFVELALLKLIYKYATFAPSYECLMRLDAMISHLQTSNSLICVNKIGGTQFATDHNNPFGNDSNQDANNPPTVNDNTINLLDPIVIDQSVGLSTGVGTAIIPIYEQIYQFTLDDFTLGFNDPDGDGVGEFTIQSLPTIGQLRYDGILMNVGQVFNDPTLVTYWKNTNNAIVESFTFTVDDNRPNNPATSAVVTMNMNVVAASNSPATIGDGIVYADNGVTTVLTVAMFSSLLTPAFNDPDGDTLHSIRIDEISTANQGQFLFTGIPVTVGQIITAGNLNAGDFVHVGPNQDAVNSDVINFSARDTGTLTWVN